jgi:hypothetical protein
MGITVIGTTLMLILAYIAQSPRLLKRLGLAGYRLDLRARLFTGYALALLLLAGGFFVAGVPLGTTPADVAIENVTPVSATSTAGAVDEVAGPVSTAAPSVTEEEPDADDGTPDSGAFGGPPPGALTATAEAAGAQPDDSVTGTATEVVLPSSTPTSTATVTPSATPSSTPTVSPTPTNTPTPIFEETAMINTGSSTIWLKRTPGGQDFVLVRGGDTVILQPGHANYGGVMWRQISTVDGTVGWVLESYLGTGEEDENAGEGG